MPHLDSRATKLQDFLAVQTLRLRNHATAAQILSGRDGAAAGVAENGGYPHELTPYRGVQQPSAVVPAVRSSSQSTVGVEEGADIARPQWRDTPRDLVDQHPRSTSVIDAFVHQLALRSQPAKARNAVRQQTLAPAVMGAPAAQVVAQPLRGDGEHKQTTSAVQPNYADIRTARNAVGGWVRTALATSPGQRPSASTQQNRDLMSETLLSSGSDDHEDDLLALRRELAAVGAELAIEQQQRLAFEETFQRRLLENAFAHQLAVWSTQSKLTVRNAMRRVAQRPSQVFLESLREKDAVEIRALKAEVARLENELRRARQVAASAAQASASSPSSVVDAPSDDERREWNELYRNLMDEVSALRSKVTERDSTIARLQDALSEARGQYLHLSAALSKQHQQQQKSAAPSWPFHTAHKSPKSPE